ncbi:hypothetical protein T06_8862 [Trichinella sp. T6]|nr:hypothetical protein T06_7591 [Trichinella sp. T6]KRX80542.1 hypothetical protein T06_8862 [Trichinella sp. T6]
MTGWSHRRQKVNCRQNDVNPLNDKKSFFNENNCGSNKKARTMKKTHTDFEERQEANKTKEHLRIIREDYLLRRIALLRASFNRQKHFVSLNRAYQTYKNQFNEFKTNVMPHYTKKMSKVNVQNGTITINENKEFQPYTVKFA